MSDTEAYRRSAVPYCQRLLNKHFSRVEEEEEEEEEGRGGGGGGEQPELYEC